MSSSRKKRRLDNTRNQVEKSKKTEEDLDPAFDLDRATNILSDLELIVTRSCDGDTVLLHRIEQFKVRLGALMPELRKRNREWELDMPEGLTAAPELFKKRAERSESSVTFLRRVYKRWIGKGLCKFHIRRLDMSLYEALNYSTLPEDLILPTKSEYVTAQIEEHAAEISAPLRLLPSPRQKKVKALRAAVLRRK
jgi:hypothetical protein